MVHLTISDARNIANKPLQLYRKIMNRDTIRTTIKQQQDDIENGIIAQNMIEYCSLYYNCYVLYDKDPKWICSHYVFTLLCFGKNRERFIIKVWSKSRKVSLFLLFLTFRTYFSSDASSILPKLLSYSYGISCFIGAASIVVFKSRFSALFSCVSTDKHVHLASKTIIFRSHVIHNYQYHQYHR